MKTEETILIQTGKDKLPDEYGVYIVLNEFDDLYPILFAGTKWENDDFEFWYKPVSEKEYLSQKIEEILPSDKDAKMRAVEDNLPIDAVAGFLLGHEFTINHIKEQMNDNDISEVEKSIQDEIEGKIIDEL